MLVKCAKLFTFDMCFAFCAKLKMLHFRRTSGFLVEKTGVFFSPGLTVFHLLSLTKELHLFCKITTLGQPVITPQPVVFGRCGSGSPSCRTPTSSHCPMCYQHLPCCCSAGRFALCCHCVSTTAGAADTVLWGERMVMDTGTAVAAA